VEPRKEEEEEEEEDMYMYEYIVCVFPYTTCYFRDDDQIPVRTCNLISKYVSTQHSIIPGTPDWTWERSQ
jgi:hypothetical protein